jgi:hypothetical protein
MHISSTQFIYRDINKASAAMVKALPAKATLYFTRPARQLVVWRQAHWPHLQRSAAQRPELHDQPAELQRCHHLCAHLLHQQDQQTKGERQA